MKKDQSDVLLTPLSDHPDLDDGATSARTPHYHWDRPLQSFSHFDIPFPNSGPFQGHLQFSKGKSLKILCYYAVLKNNKLFE